MVNSDFDKAIDLLKVEVEDKKEYSKRMLAAMNLLLRIEDAEQIRFHLHGFSENWDIPPEIKFAMFFQIFRLGQSRPEDILAFAVFLSLFYEDMSEWQMAIKEHVKDISGEDSFGELLGKYGLV